MKNSIMLQMGPLTYSPLFPNLQPINYWSSTVTTQYAGNAFAFNFSTGEQAHADKNLTTNYSAIAVHSGNISAQGQMLEVTIDIRPWSKHNPINYKKGHGMIPVAILSAEGFDAPSQIDRDSLTFGATGNETEPGLLYPQTKRWQTKRFKRCPDLPFLYRDSRIQLWGYRGYSQG